MDGNALPDRGRVVTLGLHVPSPETCRLPDPTRQAPGTYAHCGMPHCYASYALDSSPDGRCWRPRAEYEAELSALWSWERDIVPWAIVTGQLPADHVDR